MSNEKFKCLNNFGYRLVIIAFQTNRSARLKKDPTLFNHISNIKLSLSSDYCLNKRMKWNFSRNDFMQTYKNYAAFYKSYTGDKCLVSFDYVAFKIY